MNVKHDSKSLKMIKVKKLKSFSYEDHKSFGLNGYKSNIVYKITNKINGNEKIYKIKPVKLNKPYYKVWNDYDEEHYRRIILKNNSFGVYENNKLLAICIAVVRKWNNTLWIEKIEVSDMHRRKGLGTLLMKKVIQHAGSKKLRLIALETQNTNQPAIRFYLNNGFEITGFNLALYNLPRDKNEVAVFMTKKCSIKNH